MICISLSPAGMTNDAVAVHLDICVPEAICQYLYGPVASASCEIRFSTDPTYANLSTVDSANATNIINLTVPLSTELPDTLNYFDLLAVGDSIKTRIKDTINTSMLITSLNTYNCTIAGYMHIQNNNNGHYEECLFPVSASYVYIVVSLCLAVLSFILIRMLHSACDVSVFQALLFIHDLLIYRWSL